jgi:hypothetical protein
MGRLRHFQRNVGWWGLVRTFGVGALLVVVAVAVLLRDSQAFALAGALVGIAVPRALVGWLVEHIERSLLALRWMGFAIVGGAVLLSLGKERLDLEGPWFLPLLVGVVTLYLSAYFWIMSDRRIEVPK